LIDQTIIGELSAVSSTAFRVGVRSAIRALTALPACRRRAGRAELFDWISRHVLVSPSAFPVIHMVIHRQNRRLFVGDSEQTPMDNDLI